MEHWTRRRSLPTSDSCTKWWCHSGVILGVHLGVQQSTDGVEALGTVKFEAPAVLDPVSVLLVVDGVKTVAVISRRARRR